MTSESAMAITFQEGEHVQIVQGKHAGSVGVVVKAMGDRASARWRVRLTDGSTTWADAVRKPSSDEVRLASFSSDSTPSASSCCPRRLFGGLRAAELRSSPVAGQGRVRGIPRVRQGPLQPAASRSAPSQQQSASKEASKGDTVKITQEGKWCGSLGVVETVCDDGESKRWRVRMGDGSTTWVSAVCKAESGENAQASSTRAPPAQPAAATSRKFAEQRAAKEAEMRAKAQLQQEAKAARQAHLRSLRPADVEQVNWKMTKEVSYVDGGSGGIVLVDLGDECVALKPQGKTAVSEMLAHSLASLCGVRAARCRVVRFSEPDHTAIVQHCGSAPFANGDEQNMRRQFFRGKEYFGILEFVSGHPLMGIEAQQALATPTSSMLVDLGRLCALDVLLNNMDRVPLPVWQNEGNLGNVMVADAGRSIVGIDQQINPIGQGPGREKYLEKVASLIQSLRPGGDVTTLLEKLRQALAANCGAGLSDEDAQFVFEGLREGFAGIAAAWSNGRLKQTLDEADVVCCDRFQYLGGAWVLYDPSQVASMKTFVCAVAENISSCLSA